MNNQPEEYQILLDRLASLKGIETEYRDIWGNLHSLSPDIILRILSAMGCRLDSVEQLEKEIETLEHRDWGPVTPPVLIVSWPALPKEILFQIPANPESEPEGLPADLQARLDITEESGQIKIRYFSPEELGYKGTAHTGETLYLRGGLPFPQDLSLGRHQMVLILSQGLRQFEQGVLVIVCPEKTYLPPALEGGGKRAGLMVSLAGLRSGDNWGVGDFRDLKALVIWTIEFLQADVIGLLPLHAVANRQPYNISPYYPSSRFYRNPIYLSVPEIEEYPLALKARETAENPENETLLSELRASAKVQFEKVDRLKRKVLKIVFQTFLDRHWKPPGQETQRQKDFQHYMDREGELLDHFAVFCALAAYFEKENPELSTWGQWPDPFQDPCSPEVKTFAKEHWQEILFEKYLQWQVEAQLSAVQDLALNSGSEIGLYHDLALGIDPWGADSWAWREFTISGIKVGAPPDDFSPQGQDWGFSPPQEEKYRREGYQLFSLEIRKNSRPGGALRIDHVMKFSRLFWILEERPPQEGVYVRYSFEDYLKILALESNRNKTLIIGEDLGTVPDQLREVLHQYGLFSYRLFYFEKDETGNLMSPADYPEYALASVSTHDLPPLAGFWAMEDLVLRRELGLMATEEQFHQALAGRIREKRRMIDRLYQLGFLSQEERLTLQAQEKPVLTDEIHRAVVSFILNSRAKLAILTQEDLFGEKKQLNLPGTVDSYPNWSRKMRYALEELRNHPEVLKKAEMFRGLIDQSGRRVRSGRTPGKD
ncbi:MAG: 4-alpha-glucanotransferase [Deltaproteobacteria bacterium]|nr:4-alpha-glucanotransferase [Deltaproteobacteria bacterium]